jgi:hypothetical protein
MDIKEQVLYWLEKGTHPQIPIWCEKVLLALVKYSARISDFSEARQLIGKMELQEFRDQAIAFLAEAMAKKHPVEAGFLLDEITEAKISQPTARKMLQQPEMLSRPQSIYQLLLYLQEKPDELADCMTSMIEKDKDGKVSVAIRELFIEKLPDKPPALVLLDLCDHPAISDFVKPRALVKYRQQLQERVIKERNTGTDQLLKELEHEGLINPDESDELKQLMNHKS